MTADILTCHETIDGFPSTFYKVHFQFVSGNAQNLEWTRNNAKSVFTFHSGGKVGVSLKAKFKKKLI